MTEGPTQRLALGGALLLFSALIVVAWSPRLDRVDWGDAPTWTAGAIALAALAAAWRAGTVAAELLRVEQIREDRTERLEQERRDVAERAEQADWVASWNDSGRYAILNGSRLPIWDVEVRAIHPETSATFSETIGVVPPGDVRHPFVPEEDDWGAPLPVEDILGDMDALRMQVEIRFRDAAGRLWRRDQHGMLNLLGRSAFVQAVTATATAAANAVIVKASDDPGS